MKKMLLCNVIESNKENWFMYGGWEVIDVVKFDSKIEYWEVMDAEGNIWKCSYLLEIDEIRKRCG